jgi:hypothetical protein
LASPVTWKVNALEDVPPTADAVTAAVLEDVADTEFQVVRLLSVPVAVDSAETSDLICPKAEILVLMTALSVCSFVSGLCSRATNCDTMDLTSSPLPMPCDVMVAIANSLVASTGTQCALWLRAGLMVLQISPEPMPVFPQKWQKAAAG